MKFKKFEDLTIENNFLFQKVMQDEEICKEFIENLGNQRQKNSLFRI